MILFIDIINLRCDSPRDSVLAMCSRDELRVGTVRMLLAGTAPPIVMLSQVAGAILKPRAYVKIFFARNQPTDSTMETPMKLRRIPTFSMSFTLI